MSALATLVVVWLGAEKPEGRMRAALDDWAAAQGAKLESPRADPSDGGAGPQAIAEQCDRGIEEARDQFNAGDDGGARRTLARLEQTLRDHPEIVQASWLMAERYRLEAQVATRLGENADRWHDAADVLEGSRAPAFGEPSRNATPTVQVMAGVAVRGARTHETYWDGVRTRDQFSTPRGEHHLAIVRGKRVAWSGWVSALVQTTFDVWIPDAPPCSVEDFEGTAFAGESVVTVPKGVRCGAWMVASPGQARGTLRAARCQEDGCQPASTWAYEILAPVGQPKAPSGKGLPAWATWTLAGVGFAAATSLIMWRTGAFDRTEPAPKVGYDGRGL
jgi:hypothetical protein